MPRPCNGEPRLYHRLEAVLQRAVRLSTAVGDEGGFAPNPPSNEDAVKILMEAIEAAGRAKPWPDIRIAADAKYTEFYRDGQYHLAAEDRSLSAEEFVGVLATVCADRYPIISIEDGMAEDDWDGMGGLTRPAGGRRNWSATTSSSPTRLAWAPWPRRRGGQRHPHQGQPDRHPVGNPRHHGLLHPARPMRR